MPLPGRAAALGLVALAVLLQCLPSVLAFTPPHRLQEVHGDALLGVQRDAAGDPLESDCTTDHSSTVWMCISTVLVLGMSPALALFEAGMLRSKSTVSLITQIFAGVIVLSVMWVCIGYTLTFGGNGPFIGNLNHAFYIDISYTRCSSYARHIPEALFATFQMMFAVITPLLMTGAFAERMKFKGFLIYICLWELVIYYPLAHMIWGGGFLGNWGVLDFAGGIVIHTSAGIGSLIVALFLGRRKHFYDFMVSGGSTVETREQKRVGAGRVNGTAADGVLVSSSSVTCCCCSRASFLLRISLSLPRARRCSGSAGSDSTVSRRQQTKTKQHATRKAKPMRSRGKASFSRSCAC